MHRAFRMKLKTNNRQGAYFRQCCGNARFVYNWGLVKWRQLYRLGHSPSYFDMSRRLNSVRHEEFPFLDLVSVWVSRYALRNLGEAFKRFFNKVADYPRFHRKGVHESFTVLGEVVKVEGNKLWLPKVGWVRMYKPYRYSGRALKISEVTVSEYAGDWYASISAEVENDYEGESQAGVVGIDLGVKNLVTCSDGVVYKSLQLSRRYGGKLRVLNKGLARKRKKSKNWLKQLLRLQRFYRSVRNRRVGYIHQITAELVKKYGTVVMEDLNVEGMVKNHSLAGSVLDASFGEIRRQLGYKAKNLVFVDRFFPSTKRCSRCGHVQDVPLGVRLYRCEGCGREIDRDLNAAINIVRSLRPDFKPVEMGALALSDGCETAVCEAGTLHNHESGLLDREGVKAA